MRTDTGIFLTLILCFLLPTDSLKLCLVKTEEANILQPDVESVQQKMDDSAQLQGDPSGSANREELKSYKPHYIHSYSYPKPITPLIYYGQVDFRKPFFFFKDLDSTSKNSDILFFINGKAYTPATAKSFLLRQPENINRFMFVVQVENLHLDRQIESSVQVVKKEDHYLFLVRMDDELKVYQLAFVENGSEAVPLQELIERKIKLNFRQESTASNHDTWKLAEILRWQGSSNIQVSSSADGKYKGVVLQIEFEQSEARTETQIHLKQIYLNWSHKGTPEVLRRVDSLTRPNQPFSADVLKDQSCAKAATNKLFDGLSYEFGTLDIRNGSQHLRNDPKQLLSFSPSRKRFPWGFLWDDGFHCEVAVRTQHQIALKVIKSWLDTIHETGWIPREQNRGKQREYLCSCPRFMAKDIRDGNPPTLILALDYLNRKNMLSPENLPQSYWQKLEKWYSWYLNTLQVDKDLFKWIDSVNNQGASFTSGMDDFPRPINSQAHIDLQSWMYFFSTFMAQASPKFSSAKVKQYSQKMESIRKNQALFLDQTDNILKDFDKDRRFSANLGYPSILPIAFGMIEENSETFKGTMKLIKQLLDTGNGLSSIAMNNPMYLKNGDSYWTGPVWININYMVLRGLKLYYPSEGEFYEKLRSDLLATVCGNYEEKGYFYENYIHGKGSFSFPFNGWTSLIAIVESQDY